MKKVLKFLINRPIIVLIILTTLIFVPPLVVMQAQSQKKLIIRTLGVDLVGDEIEVTAVCYQPSNSQTFNENYTLISARDKNLTTALDKVGDYAGKQIGLAHLSEIVVSNDFAENNLIGRLNYLIRTYPTNNSTNIINTNVSAKEFLQETLKTEGRKVGQESGIVEHNNEFVVGNYSNIEELVASKYKPSKTTVVDILLGLLQLQSGRILADGIEVREHYEEWLKNIGYIPQTIFMIDSTIRKNVAFGYADEDIDDTKVWAALREAQLDEFVRGLPEGLDTGIGERGIRLSGGQRQRIGIARALFEDPEVLVLDEATSALDNETEAAIMDSINRLHGRKTLIIIAHRLQTIEKCDMVYRVENGKVTRER